MFESFGASTSAVFVKPFPCSCVLCVHYVKDCYVNGMNQSECMCVKEVEHALLNRSSLVW